MEIVNKHWPKITVGVVAIAVGIYIYKKSSDNKVAAIADIAQLSEGCDGKVWPYPRRIVDSSADRETQQKQLEKWLEQVFKKFIKMHGSFTVDDDNNLKSDDFQNIYDLIESYARFDLHPLRKQNEDKRKSMFQKAFIEKGDSIQQAQKDYVNQLYSDIAEEVNLYKDVQEKILKICKINENIWNSSMDAYLPSGEQYIRKAL